MVVGCEESEKPIVKTCQTKPLIIDTVLLEVVPNATYEKGNTGEEMISGGCIVYRKLTRNIYFNPIINHSKIKP